MPLDADRLLATVRGRRLLWQLVHDRVWSDPAWIDLDSTEGPVATADSDLLRPLHAAVRSADGVDEHDLLVALAGAVDWARYWQEPPALEGVLARPAVRAALAPLAARVAAATPTWWSGPLARADQHRVRWVDTHARPEVVDARAALLAWRRRLLADERLFAARHLEDATPWSGEWWSTPGYALPTTTRTAGGLPAVHLALVEDEFGWTAADIDPVTVASDARVYEVAGAGDWAALVACFPLEVTHSRRHDWFRTTGRTGRWFLPDFALVADSYDAVHVSVAGYLDTAGAAVPVPGHPKVATVLAGWSPDETWWLGPPPALAGPAERWEREQDPLTSWDWVRVG